MTTNLGTGGAIQTPEKSHVIAAFGEELIFHITGAQTGGKWTMWTELTPPGGGPPLHWHDNEDELFLVLEGQASFFYEGKWTEVPPGTSVFMPRGTVHAFRNVGATPLKQLIQTQPSGFETFMARAAEEFAKPGEPDMEKVVQISAEHGIHFTKE